MTTDTRRRLGSAEARLVAFALAVLLGTVGVLLLGLTVRPAHPTTPQVGYPPLAGRALRATRSCLADTALVSQARLAALAGISPTRISRVERGLDTLTTAEADRLYRVLAPMVRQRIGDRTFVWLYVLYRSNP